ncbi:OB-fold nucleic acid binding domain-containing protein [Parabacteroides sp. W1-Q-101]|uniref:OB-fold nucleic acid binding domain-containing protein n=1 Tax=Parabacteroides TaxID=375288 RepID=UPI00202F53E0|nr:MULTISPECIES: OB-fold nucleic acid binding domain-containing protein [Parabacteroides]MCM0718010.1 OB-fold nucleic acid binding domain-containing protein [Parabacteroides sp. W1-Q-101]
MFKYLSLSLCLAFCLTACNSNNKQTTQQEEKSCCAASASKAIADAYTPEKLMKEGNSLVDKEVAVKGFVTHVCKHAGKKCFLSGEDGSDMSVQVMAGGDIASFDKELIGSEIEVKGILQEHRITKEVIGKQEASVKEEMEKEGCEMERCDAVMKNVNQMKEWMADKGKDYYPVYYVNATHYEVVK